MAFTISIIALLIAALATTSLALVTPLYNKATGVHTGTPYSDPDAINRIVVAREIIMTTSTNATDIEILRKSDGTDNSEAFIATYPFTTFKCGGFSSTTTSKRSPVIIFPQTSMPDIGVGLPMALYFICAESPISLGVLYGAQSFDLGETWSTPTIINTSAVPVAVSGLLLKGISPVIASINTPSEWLLPVQTLTCSFSVLVLSNYGWNVNATNSLKLCLDDTSTGLQVSSATLSLVPNNEYNISANNQRLAVFALMTDLKTTQVVSCDTTASDCSDASFWSSYSSIAPAPIPPHSDVLATGIVPSLMAIASYGATAPGLPAACSPLPKIAIAAQTRFADNSSLMAFSLSKNVTSLLSNDRVVVGAAYGAIASLVAGIVLIPLPPSISGGQCTEQWSYFISVVGSDNNYAVGTFTNNPLPSWPNPPPDNGSPGLAAGITFSIIGGVVVSLAVVFMVGYLRHRKDATDVDKLEADEHASTNRH